MRMLLIATALAGLGLGTAAARAEPVQLDENGLRAVTAGAETAAAPTSLNVNISNPVNVSNKVDVSNQVGTALAVGVNAAVAAFSNNVAASGATTSNIGLSAP